MSFTYQRTHKSVCIDTRPRLSSAHTLFDSEDEDEEECDGQVERGHRPLVLTEPPEAASAGDPAWRFKPVMGMQMKSAIDLTNVYNINLSEYFQSCKI